MYMCVALADLATDLELQQPAIFLIVDEHRRDVGELRTVVDSEVASVDGEARPDTPGAVHREAAARAHPHDLADLGVGIGCRQDTEIAGSPQARGVDLRLVSELEAGGGLGVDASGFGSRAGF